MRPLPKALTFDCYGTIVDWNQGIEEALARVGPISALPAERRRAIRVRREAVELERHLGRGYRPYLEILAASLVEAAREEGVDVSEGESRAFAASMGSWPFHPDAPEGLKRLRKRFRLAILSNVDRATLLETVRRLGVPFDLLVTAEDVRSYKPALPHFERALSELRLAPEAVLHVSYAAEHDLRPAAQLGIPTAFVRRGSATLPPDVRPRVVVQDLVSLADFLEA